MKCFQTQMRVSSPAYFFEKFDVTWVMMSWAVFSPVYCLQTSIDFSPQLMFLFFNITNQLINVFFTYAATVGLKNKE